MEATSPMSSSLDEQHGSNTAAGAKKAKKTEILGLQDQIRPLLNSLDIVMKPCINVDFDFTLRSVLLESALYVVVFEDIPFNLWSSFPTTGGKSSSAHLSAAAATANNSSTSHLTSIRKIQQFFLSSINESLRNLDLESNGGSNGNNNAGSNSTPYHQFHPSHFSGSSGTGPSGSSGYYSSRSSQHLTHSDEQIKAYDALVESMKTDVKNAIVLKLNDIKSGDFMAKQITENLSKSENVSLSDFGLYHKIRSIILIILSLKIQRGNELNQ